MNTKFSIDFSANSFDKDTFVVLWEETNNSNLENLYHVGPEAIELNNPANLHISYPDQEKNPDFNPLHYSIYRKETSGEWKRLESWINKNIKTVVAETDKLGEFKLVYNFWILLLAKILYQSIIV